MSAAQELGESTFGKPGSSARADAIRRTVLEVAIRSRTCHIGSALSLVDLLAVLRFKTMKRDDRLVLSKGHGALALYATLVEAGLLDRDALLDGYCRDGGTLLGHPERGTPGVELTSGSLGHGLSVAVGMALADRLDGSRRRTFCVLGDGELNEGSVWEALALAAHLGLSSLVAIVDANGLQGLGPTREVLDLEPLGERLSVFGWDSVEVDGHDHAGLSAALAARGPRPRAVVARTVKGYGVDFMEGELMWHYRTLSEADRDRVMAALEGRRRAA